MMGYYEGDWGTGQWLAMSAMMLLFWGPLVALVVYAVSVLGSGHRRDAGGGAATSGAGRVLAERFARGEIDEEEFLHRHELLRSSAARP